MINFIAILPKSCLNNPCKVSGGNCIALPYSVAGGRIVPKRGVKSPYRSAASPASVAFRTEGLFEGSLLDARALEPSGRSIAAAGLAFASFGSAWSCCLNYWRCPDGYSRIGHTSYAPAR